jgi:hypothetical protein
MSEAKPRKSLMSGMPAPKAAPDATPEKSANPGKTRAIIMTCIFLVLLALVAYRYASSEGAQKDVPEPVVEPQPQPPQPGQPRNNTPPPPGQQPIPKDIISG